MDWFVKKCREYGMKVTPQRTLVFEILSMLHNHPTVAAVAREVALRSPNVSFDTVNRTLQTFVDMGILHKIPATGNGLRFDTNPLPHHHVQCVRCGRIVDFESPELDSIPVPKAVSARYKVLSKMVVFETVCDECARSKQVR